MMPSPGSLSGDNQDFGLRSRYTQEAKPATDDEGHGFARLFESGDELRVVELSKSGWDPKVWVHSPGRAVTSLHGQQGLLSRSWRGWRKVLLAAFLPVDFPNSVSHDYLAYQTYDSLQAFFSTITSLLSSRALLEGLGVGDVNSSATFAMLLTILRDAISHIVTILFAHRFGLSIEPEAKKFRFLADLFNDTAFFLELASPYLNAWGKALAMCLGEGLRASCGVAAGASKAALSLHFARNDNMSELSAKEASQETAVSLVGLLVGTVVVQLVRDQRAVVYLVVALVLAHLWMNYRGVRSVCMNTLKKQRATILFSIYRQELAVGTPARVAEQERILLWKPLMRNACHEPVAVVDFATSYPDATSSGRAGPNVVAVDGPRHTRFVRPYAPGQPARIKILLWHGAKAKHAVQAWFMAMDTAWAMELDVPYGDTRPPPRPSGGRFVRPRIIDGWRPRARDDLLWARLEEQGWDLDIGAMEAGPGVRLGVEMTERKSK